MIKYLRTSVARTVAAQLATPRGVLGRITGRVMNAVNAGINRHAVQLLDLSPTHHVLEIGFGGGDTLPVLLRHVSQGRVHGIELSRTMLDSARTSNEHALEAGNLELAEGDASALPWSDASFDRALSVNALYFWKAPLTVFAEIRRVLRPNGLLVLGYRPKAMMGRLSVTEHGFRVYTDDELLDVLHEARFQVLEMRYGGKGQRGHVCIVAQPI